MSIIQAKQSTEVDQMEFYQVPRGSWNFQPQRFDQLLEDAGIDVVVMTSDHSQRHMSGGFAFFNYDRKPAVGVSRYLPVIIYRRGFPEETLYVAHARERSALEAHVAEGGRFSIPQICKGSFTSTGSMEQAILYLQSVGVSNARIGIEGAFMPGDVRNMLAEALPDCELVDARRPLELLRAIKSPEELDVLREASERIVQAMLATFASAKAGMTKHDLMQSLHVEQAKLGLDYNYSLVGMGSGLSRTPTNEALKDGDIFSLDSGGDYKGYIGDLCRMAILGREPDAELQDLLGHVDDVQMAARNALKDGVPGSVVYAAAEEAIRKSGHQDYLEFVGHGTGLVNHETPRLTDTGPVPYPASDAELTLHTGMVLSIETIMLHPKRGFIKLEDTVAVTQNGSIGFGDEGRGWNVVGG